MARNGKRAQTFKYPDQPIGPCQAEIDYLNFLQCDGRNPPGLLCLLFMVVKSQGILGMLAGLTIVCVLWHIGGSSFQSEDYDDGVYLSTARAVAEGFPLYSSVFFGQPPLSAELLALGVKWINPSEFGPRVVLLIFNVMALVGIGLIANRLFGRRAIPIAVALLATQYSRVGTFWICQAEIFSLGFALLAVGVPMIPSLSTPVAALSTGALFAMAMLCKVWAIPVLCPILLAPLAFTTPSEMKVHSWRKIFGFLAFLLTGAGATGVVVLSKYDFAEMFRQAITFHVQARATSGNTGVLGNFGMICDYFAKFWGIGALSILGCIWGTSDRKVTSWIGGWFLASLAFLFVHTPLFGHHLLLLTPPLTLWAAAAITKMIDRTATAGMRICQSVAMVGLTFMNGSPSANSMFEFRCASPSPQAKQREQEAIRALQILSDPSDWVGGDEQALIFRANRMIPPELCDTSYVRIKAGYLSCAETINAANRCSVIVFGSGRLVTVPGFTRWVETHFEKYSKVDSPMIYFRRHRSTNDRLVDGPLADKY